jgi:hypothetical protein
VLYDIYRRLPSMHATLSAYSTKNAGLLHEQYTDELAVRTMPAREALLCFAPSSCFFGVLTTPYHNGIVRRG